MAPRFARARVLLRHVLSGHWAAALLILVYAGLFVQTVSRFPFVSPFSTVDEQLNYYLAGRNYVTYGFLSTALLQDLSSSSNPAEHPFVYNHMPPGPEVLTGALMGLFGEQYQFIRVVFGAVFVAGLICLLRFASLALGTFGLTGAGFALLLVSPRVVMHSVDHPAYCAVPLLLFFPPVALQVYYATGRRRAYVAALLVVFLGSLYFVYQHALMALMSWTLLALLGLMRFERRHLVSFLAAAIAGQVMHQVQSLVLLGPEVFAKDMWFTVSNRMFGVPTSEQLRDFYQSHAMVLHGTHRFDPARTVESIGRALEFPGSPWIIAAAVLMLAWTVGRAISAGDPGGRSSAAREAYRLAGWAIWIAASLALPFLAFPAFSADYGLSGIDEFYFAIGRAIVIALVARELVRRVKDLWVDRAEISRPLIGRLYWWMRSRTAQIASLGLAIGLLGLVVTGLQDFAESQQTGFRWVTRDVSESPPFSDLTALTQYLQGQVVMTNVYPTTATFFTRAAGFGGCEQPAFPADGEADPGRCFARFIRGFPDTVRPEPRYYVLFRWLFTGFNECQRQACVSEIHEKVAARYPVLFETGLFTVFDLRPERGLMGAVGTEGQRINLSNVGPWDGYTGSVSGLEATFLDGRWVVDESPMQPVNQNPTFRQVDGRTPIAPWSMRPSNAAYRLIRMEDEEGPFLRVQATRSAESLALTDYDLAPALNGAPVSIRAEVRARTAGEVRLRLNKPGSHTRLFVTEARDASSWTTMTLRVLNDDAVRPSDHYSIGIWRVAGGDWLDIRQVNVYAGILP